MRRTLLAAALLTACGPAIPTDPCAVPLGRSTDTSPSSEAAIALPPTTPPLYRLGQQITLDLSDVERLASDCTVGERFESFSAEVLDPALEPMMATVTSTRAAAPSQGITARVSFTPTRAGWYHVTSTFKFDSRTRIQQNDFLVVVDRTATPAVEFPARCAQVARTGSDDWLCDGALYREGTQVQVLPAGVVEIAGDAVWLVTSSAVTRYTDPGTGPLNQAAGQSLSVSRSGELRLLASEDELLVAGTNRLWRYRLDAGGALVAAGEVSIPAVGSPPRMSRDGQTLWVASAKAAGTSFCPYAVEAATISRTATPCTQSTSRLVGNSAAGFWIWSGSVVRELRPGTTELAPGSWLSIPTGYDLEGGTPKLTQVPFVAQNFLRPPPEPTEEPSPWYLPELFEGSAALAQYEKRAGYQFLGATERLVWETQLATGKTLVFAR